MHSQHTVLHRDRLEEQYDDLEQQHEAAAIGMWVFLATEVMFFGALFLARGRLPLSVCRGVREGQRAS